MIKVLPGYAYKQGTYSLDATESTVKVCIGKCIAVTGTVYVMAVLSLKNGSIEDNNVLLQAVKSGCFVKSVFVVDMSSVGIEDYSVCLGKVIDTDKIDLWLSQLRIMGCTFQYTDRVRKYGYIGDWKKREKLPCIKEFEIGKVYIKEPLAYVRGTIRTLFYSDILFVYRGTKQINENILYLWDEYSVFRWKYNKEDANRHHQVRERYTNMVEVHWESWNIKD